MATTKRTRNGSVTAESRASAKSMLIIEVDVAGIAAPGEPARSYDVRLVRGVRDAWAEQARHARSGEVTAALILRDLTVSRLVSCVRAVTQGGGSISPELLCQMLPEGAGKRPDSVQPQLTDREYEVLRMLADGESTRSIAERLSYSERTVKNIVHDLLAKLGCRTRAHAVALATRQGVI